MQSLIIKFCAVGLLTIASIVQSRTAVAQTSYVPEEIAQQAKQAGHATDGALVFYSLQLGCARCHDAGVDASMRIGPDLTRYPQDQRPTDVELVEAITNPSKRIRQGFENNVIITSDGRTVTGRILEKRPTRLCYRIHLARFSRLMQTRSTRCDRALLLPCLADWSNRSAIASSW